MPDWAMPPFRESMSLTNPQIAPKASPIAFSRNYFARFIVFCTFRGMIPGRRRKDKCQRV